MVLGKWGGPMDMSVQQREPLLGDDHAEVDTPQCVSSNECPVDEPEGPNYTNRWLLWISGALNILLAIAVIGLTVWITRTDHQKQLTNPGFRNECDSSNSSAGSELKMCPPEWLLHGGECYYFSSKLKNWTKSHEYCSSRDAHLPVLQDKAELDFLTSKISKYHWIGLFNTAPGRSWTWVNGSVSNNKLLAVTGSADGDRCGSMKISNLESAACVNELRWICEKHAE